MKALLAHIHGDPALARIKPPLAPFSRRRSRRRGRRLRSGARQARRLSTWRRSRNIKVAYHRRRHRRAHRRDQPVAGRLRRAGLRAGALALRGRRRHQHRAERVAAPDPARAGRGVRQGGVPFAVLPSAPLAGRPHADQHAARRPRSRTSSARRTRSSIAASCMRCWPRPCRRSACILPIAASTSSRTAIG